MSAVITIVGPTAAGKTATALELAAQLSNCSILSADSRQIYRYLDVGTAKPTSEERSVCPHYFLDICNPDEYYSAGTFAGDAASCIRRIMTEGGRPLVVGGSGMYVAALFEGVFDEPAGDFTAVREILNKRLETEGRDALFEELLAVDALSAARYPDRNPRRIIRALEFYHASGKRFSDYLPERRPPEFHALYFGIAPLERAALYDRINLRCEHMWRSGLLAETETVLNLGYSSDLNALNTVGYKEAISFLREEMPEATALELMKQHTRNYAKRQMTWFRRNTAITWLHGTPEENARTIFAEYEKSHLLP